MPHSGRRKIDFPLGRLQQLYYEGWSRDELAREFNVSATTINNRLAEIHKQIPTREEAKAFIERYLTREWRKTGEAFLSNRMADQVNRLDDIYPGLADEVFVEIRQKSEHRKD